MIFKGLKFVISHYALMSKSCMRRKAIDQLGCIMARIKTWYLQAQHLEFPFWIKVNIKLSLSKCRMTVYVRFSDKLLLYTFNWGCKVSLNSKNVDFLPISVKYQKSVSSLQTISLCCILGWNFSFFTSWKVVRKRLNVFSVPKILTIKLSGFSRYNDFLSFF